MLLCDLGLERSFPCARVVEHCAAQIQLLDANADGLCQRTNFNTVLTVYLQVCTLHLVLQVRTLRYCGRCWDLPRHDPAVTQC